LQISDENIGVETKATWRCSSCSSRERKRRAKKDGEKEARFTRQDAVLVNQEVDGQEVSMALTKWQLGVEQSAIKAFAFSFGKQNPSFLVSNSTLDFKSFNMFKLVSF